MHSHTLALLLLLVGCVAWQHGKPQPGDNPQRSQSATEMLNRLFGAARERANEARKQRVAAEAEGVPYSPTNADMFAGLMDYAKDKWQNPPLLQVERNLMMLERNTRLLAKEIVTIRELLNTLVQTLEEPTDVMDTMGFVLNTTLHPVQGKHYTIIKN